ncbi:MFS superfamily sulfate permease-like transporter [Sphingobium wenxiniae]|uniref:MFS superfamily sulfate permease-like transporter n=1 Tax=Sphingobium wenxiniae (strain DSM 21828 / CGMCC 1.7748 / JZ-1) TaxID=595605 RepID=A0A562KII8_SPHWJ|nr:SulP family inorganic anion transporter [Sphingobium wenxiniae]MBB6190481.1 MFS superfamily sulfate permease-like transporter [Sphingobium wenxiniae]TWH95196.1 MFS superfamily sulfate permease-like transporter [Sphingobium wenxiniae]
MLKAFSGGTLSRDFTASIVVFLVAMPLCMGIAIASGVPPEKGLVTGIIGGIVVGLLAGSPLQVSGPAAGLAVIVFEIVQQQGLSALGPILILAGAIQVIAGLLRVGGWFRAISPAVVHGMLAGIGVLIVVGQFHVLFDDKPLSSGLANLLAMPGQIFGLTNQDAAMAFAVGLVTISGMIGWEKIRPASMKLLPGALVGVVLATLVAFFLGLPVARVAVPESIMSAVTLPEGNLFAQMMTPSVITTAVAIAFIASAETLLSAAAVDRMHDGVRTNYNRELSAQGVGNLLCGFAGALPMTGVIVRSSANVQAGGKTRLSTILHGIWILGFVALLPWLLREIPMAALAGILVVTGVRLVSLDHAKHLLHRYGPLPAVVWAATLVTVVTTDLLTGVLVGIGLSLLEMLPHVRRLGLKIDETSWDNKHEVALDGTASFFSLPGLSARLEALPAGRVIILNVERLGHIDHTCAEMLREWIDRRRNAGMEVELFGAAGRLRQLAA